MNMKNVIVTALKSIDTVNRQEDKMSAAMEMLFDDFQGISRFHVVTHDAIVNVACAMFDNVDAVREWFDWYMYDMPEHCPETDTDYNVVMDGVGYHVEDHESFADFLIDVFCVRAEEGV